MGKCKNCKWWGTNPDERDDMPSCASPKLIFTDGYDHYEPKPDDVIIQDGSGYFARLYPGPEFGCDNFEAK